MQAEAIIQALKIAQNQARQSGEISTQINPLAECGLDNVDCPSCHNTGYIVTKLTGGGIKAEKCACMAKRVSIRNLKRSGLKDLISRYTFKNYIADDGKRKEVKSAAEVFCSVDEGWFYISGKSGSGKTHICTAICSRLMDSGKAVRYMLWRDDSAELKSLVTDAEEYQRRIRPFKTVPVLYIDDFLKGGNTEADIRLAFEILNSRYNDSKLRTVISSELSLFTILNIDEALGGRIYERSKGFCLQAPGENWRLKG